MAIITVACGAVLAIHFAAYIYTQISSIPILRAHQAIVINDVSLSKYILVSRWICTVHGLCFPLPFTLCNRKCSAVSALCGALVTRRFILPYDLVACLINMVIARNQEKIKTRHTDLDIA